MRGGAAAAGMRRRTIFGLGIVTIVVTLSLLNASWIAPTPPGRLTVVAQRGIVQPLKEGADPAGCAAAQITPPEGSLWIENSLASLYKSTRIGADAVEVDARPTADGRIVLFRDATLDCRTDGRGRVAEKTLAELKALDIGHGYTADGGRSFPLRGRGIGAMPTVEEALHELRGVAIVFRIAEGGAAAADALLAEFARTGLDPAKGHGYYGDPAALARIRERAPQAWTFDAAALEDCLAPYRGTGWTGLVPEACEERTIGVPLSAGRWILWGWPYRFLDRMAGAGSEVLVYRDLQDDAIRGLDRVEQYDDVPRQFKGWLFVDDFGTVGASLRR